MFAFDSQLLSLEAVTCQCHGVNIAVSDRVTVHVVSLPVCCLS